MARDSGREITLLRPLCGQLQWSAIALGAEIVKDRALVGERAL